MTSLSLASYDKILQPQVDIIMYITKSIKERRAAAIEKFFVYLTGLHEKAKYAFFFLFFLLEARCR